MAGVQFMVDPAWDYTTAHRTFTFTDDDANLAGDHSADELGNDSGQTAVVTDASGATRHSGRVYAEASAVFPTPDGSTITLYVLEIGGVVVGEVTSVPDVSTGPTYASLASMSFDPDLANVIQAGSIMTRSPPVRATTASMPVLAPIRSMAALATTISSLARRRHAGGG